MLGAGSSPSGMAPAGADPSPTVGAPRNVSYPRAIEYLAQQRGFPVDADGRFIDIHPVDQRVALKLSIVAGSLSSNPEVGHTVRSVRPGLASTTRAAQDAVRLAVADELAANEIRIVSIDVESVGAALFVAVVYENLVTQQQQTARAPIG